MIRNLEEQTASRSWLRRLLMGSGIMVLLLAGAGYAWTFTPSYSLYRIKHALEAHDYQTFSRYVDVDSVLDHALEEFADEVQKDPAPSAPSDPLVNALRKGLKRFARDAREIAKAGLEIAVEQAVRNPEQQLPQIPAIAIVGALWHGRTDGDTVSFPVKVKKGGPVEVRMRQTPEDIWRVVEVANLSALLQTMRSRRFADQ